MAINATANNKVALKFMAGPVPAYTNANVDNSSHSISHL
jgi:hypothetical protein